MSEKGLLGHLVFLYDLEVISRTDEVAYIKFENKEFMININKIGLTEQNLTKLSFADRSSLIGNNYFETVLINQSYGISIKEQTVKDQKNSLEYIIGLISDELYFAYLVDYCNLVKNHAIFLKRIAQENLKLKLEENYKANSDFILFLKKFTFSKSSIIIKSNKNRKGDVLRKLMYSFLFDLSINNNILLTPSSDYSDAQDNLINKKKPFQNVISPPNKIYVEELIYFYQNGIKNTSEDIQFLSFYHILEHYFEKVYLESVTNKIINRLNELELSTSHRQLLEDSIKKEIKRKPELYSLKLVLDKFISDLDFIKNKLNEYNENFINYFNTRKVTFSDGNTINFNRERKQVLTDISNRIYKTRNAIVHSKESEDYKFIPFKHNKELATENILLKILAEEIIKNSSTSL